MHVCFEYGNRFILSFFVVRLAFSFFSLYLRFCFILLAAGMITGVHLWAGCLLDPQDEE